MTTKELVYFKNYDLFLHIKSKYLRDTALEYPGFYVIDQAGNTKSVIQLGPWSFLGHHSLCDDHTHRDYKRHDARLKSWQNTLEPCSSKVIQASQSWGERWVRTAPSFFLPTRPLTHPFMLTIWAYIASWEVLHALQLCNVDWHHTELGNGLRWLLPLRGFPHTKETTDCLFMRLLDFSTTSVAQTTGKF